MAQEDFECSFQSVNRPGRSDSFVSHKEESQSLLVPLTICQEDARADVDPDTVGPVLDGDQPNIIVTSAVKRAIEPVLTSRDEVIEETGVIILEYIKEISARGLEQIEDSCQSVLKSTSLPVFAALTSHPADLPPLPIRGQGA
eukprot:GFUD01039629.1.p1 GENE.GFUD01039629.1~~GFUD01039629.1.p1  ORF type:complete len:158 (-),score=38.65 GFUD01039629.1:348-776(-)